MVTTCYVELKGRVVSVVELDEIDLAGVGGNLVVVIVVGDLVRVLRLAKVRKTARSNI